MISEIVSDRYVRLAVVLMAAYIINAFAIVPCLNFCSKSFLGHLYANDLIPVELYLERSEIDLNDEQSKREIHNETKNYD